MARIAGVDIPSEKRVDVSLTYIYGIGPTLSKKILDQAGVNRSTRTHELSEQEVNKINAIIANDYKVEGDLRRDMQQNIRRLIEIGSYRGIRHRRGLPVRGQHCRTNARTRKGPKKTVGRRKREEE